MTIQMHKLNYINILNYKNHVNKDPEDVIFTTMIHIHYRIVKFY